MLKHGRYQNVIGSDDHMCWIFGTMCRHLYESQLPRLHGEVSLSKILSADHHKGSCRTTAEVCNGPIWFCPSLVPSGPQALPTFSTRKSIFSSVTYRWASSDASAPYPDPWNMSDVQPTSGSVSETEPAVWGPFRLDVGNVFVFTIGHRWSGRCQQVSSCQQDSCNSVKSQWVKNVEVNYREIKSAAVL